ncbi:MAG TPA: hypothetical protein DHV16_02100 [Nitrospiraceae bacterium]|nr:MAG: hypothetical protein A2X55_00530 [Nitrospirae bacterium GWB2_47_37]HAK89908.1 hypothetical protein [Nitrospiraceae bacterium]HCZ11054.1 hypothetical protein [Nitrospiraceae bacterium]
MKGIRILLCLCCILGIAALSFAAEKASADWKLFAVSTGESADDTYHYYDVKTLSRTTEGVVRVWGKKVYSTTEDIYKEHLELWELDIPKKQARMVSSTAILRDGDRKIPARTIEGPINIYDGTILGTLTSACNRSVKGQSPQGLPLILDSDGLPVR